MVLLLTPLLLFPSETGMAAGVVVAVRKSDVLIVDYLDY
jgi:hypothetical protein